VQVYVLGSAVVMVRRLSLQLCDVSRPGDGIQSLKRVSAFPPSSALNGEHRGMCEEVRVAGRDADQGQVRGGAALLFVCPPARLEHRPGALASPGRLVGAH
jgi:hypothetical protein